MTIYTGRRKEATAIVRLKKGKGVITVNKKSIDEYFGRDVAKMIVKQPLVLAEVEQSFDIDIKVNGGGSFGQAGAIRLAISKALIDENDYLDFKEFDLANRWLPAHLEGRSKRFVTSDCIAPNDIIKFFLKHQ